MPANFVYNTGMKQYTIRKVPDYLDRIARRKSEKSHQSLNSVLLEALNRGLDAGEELKYDDMDDLIGTWVADSQTDTALESFNEIDDELWT